MQQVIKTAWSVRGAWVKEFMRLFIADVRWNVNSLQAMHQEKVFPAGLVP